MTLLVKEMMDYMNRNNLNQSQFAEKMKVSPAAISYWFAEKRKPDARSFISFLLLMEKEKEQEDEENA